MSSAYIISISLLLCVQISLCDLPREDTALNEKFLSKFDNVINAITDQEINSLRRNNKLLDVLNRIDSKLESVLATINHKGEAINERSNEIFSNCGEALAKTRKSGIYTMKLKNYELPFPVYCDAGTSGGNWTVIQRRQDGSVDFYRNWNEYQNGFGDLSGEFFIGLDKLHALTTESPQELLIELEDFKRESWYAKYDAFAIGGESEDYALNVLGSYSGDAEDSLIQHKNCKFSTKDRENAYLNCARDAKGAWWYRSYRDCHYSNLNGLYLNGSHTQKNPGIEWYLLRGENYSFKRVQMLIRPKHP